MQDPAFHISIENRSIIRSAEIAKALSHPARIAILKILFEKKASTCGEITEILPLAQATVSQHLKALKTVGLINSKSEGVRIFYCLSQRGIKELQSVLSDLSDEFVHKCC